MSLDFIRAEIDSVDDKILELLEKRVELAKKTKLFKKEIIDAKRENEIYSRLKSDSINENQLQKIFSEVINACREAQKKI